MPDKPWLLHPTANKPFAGLCVCAHPSVPWMGRRHGSHLQSITEKLKLSLWHGLLQPWNQHAFGLSRHHLRHKSSAVHGLNMLSLRSVRWCLRLRTCEDRWISWRFGMVWPCIVDIYPAECAFMMGNAVLKTSVWTPCRRACMPEGLRPASKSAYFGRRRHPRIKNWGSSPNIRHDNTNPSPA